MFGEVLHVQPNEAFSLGFDLEAVAGVARVDLIAGGAVLKSESFAASPTQLHADFPAFTTPKANWYALGRHRMRCNTTRTRDPIWANTPDRCAGRKARRRTTAERWPALLIERCRAFSRHTAQPRRKAITVGRHHWKRQQPAERAARTDRAPIPSRVNMLAHEETGAGNVSGGTFRYSGRRRRRPPALRRPSRIFVLPPHRPGAPPQR